MDESIGIVRTVSSEGAETQAAAVPFFDAARERRSGVLTATCDRRTRLFFVQ